jgi:hypothetical protein
LFDEAYHLWMCPDTGYTGDSTAVISIDVQSLNYRDQWNCVKFDAAGNFYVGVLTKGSDFITPAGFASDNAFVNHSGSVVKYAAGATGTLVTTPSTTVTGQAKIYSYPYGPLSGDNSSHCTCRNSYFDVDPYGRLYIPNGSLSKIYVSDNAGNAITSFGQYGNTDARGGLAGPGRTYDTPYIPMGWPTSVGASEDYLYIADATNSRLLRVKLDYALDNIPGVTDNNSGAEVNAGRAGFFAAAAPNPFYPLSNIRFTLTSASQVRISVYDAAGRLVRDLVKGNFASGPHYVQWDGRNAKGVNMASGLYLYRVAAGGRVKTLAAVMSR